MNEITGYDDFFNLINFDYQITEPTNLSINRLTESIIEIDHFQFRLTKIYPINNPDC